MRQRSVAEGFTLVELMIVLVISSLLLLAVITIYERYVTESRIQKTHAHVREVAFRINAHFPATLRLPCPAAPNQSMYDEDYGAERCDLISIPAGTCSPEGVCVAIGSRDADGDGALDEVVIGAVPVQTLREDQGQKQLSNDVSLDGYGNKLSYAVSKHLLGTGTFGFDRGVVVAVDEFGAFTAGMTNASGEPDAHFVIVSHGRDGRGAYAPDGGRPEGCVAGSTVDAENCDDDGVFVQALAHSTGGNAQHYDDYVYFEKMEDAALWANIPTTGADGRTTISPDIENLNSGAVVIGRSPVVPAEQLEVTGNLLDANAGNDLGAIRTDEATRVNRICEKSRPENCVDVAAFTGTGRLRCRQGEVLTGIAAGAALCTRPAFSGVTMRQRCCPPYWLKGIDSNGNIICTGGGRC